MSGPRPAPLVNTTRQVAEALWLAAVAERIGAPEIVTRLAPYVEAAIRAAGPAYDDADGLRDCEANSVMAALLALRGPVRAVAPAGAEPSAAAIGGLAFSLCQEHGCPAGRHPCNRCVAQASEWLRAAYALDFGAVRPTPRAPSDAAIAAARAVAKDAEWERWDPSYKVRQMLRAAYAVDVGAAAPRDAPRGDS